MNPAGLVADTADDHHDARLIWRREFIAVAIAVAAIRAAYSWGRVSFLHSPDEFAIGGMARYISGTGDWNMFVASTWRPGYATVLAPLFWVTSDPERFVRGALVANAVVAGWSAMFLAGIGERVSGLRGRGLLLSTALLMSVPAALSASSYVWSEAAVTLTFLATVWHLIRFFESHTMSSALATSAWAVAGYTCHGRLLPLVGVATLLVAVEAARTRATRIVFAVVTLSALGVLASDIYANWIFDAVWESQGQENSVSAVARRLLDPVEVLDAAAGQVWYLLVTTVGCIGLGAYALVVRSGEGRHGPERQSRGLVMLATVPLVCVSIVFLSGRTRADYFVYGRYNDSIVAPITLAGVGWLVTSSRSVQARAWTAVITPVIALTWSLGLMVQQLHGHQLSTSSFISLIAGLQPIANDSGGIAVLTATALGTGLSFSLAAAGRWGARCTRCVTLGAMGVIAVAGISARAALPPTTNPHRTAAVIREVDDAVLGESGTIYVNLIPERFEPDVPFTQQRSRALAYQWYLDTHEFELLPPDLRTPGAIVIATVQDGYLKSIDAELLWIDPAFPMGVWRL